MLRSRRVDVRTLPFGDPNEHASKAWHKRMIASSELYRYIYINPLSSSIARSSTLVLLLPPPLYDQFTMPGDSPTLSPASLVGSMYTAPTISPEVNGLNETLVQMKGSLGNLGVSTTLALHIPARLNISMVG